MILVNEYIGILLSVIFAMDKNRHIVCSTARNIGRLVAIRQRLKEKNFRKTYIQS